MAKTTKPNPKVKKTVDLMDKDVDQRLRQINPSKSLMEKVPKTDEAKAIRESKELKNESSELLKNVNGLMLNIIKSTEALTKAALRQTTEIAKGSVKTIAQAAEDIKGVVAEDIHFNKQAIAAQMFRNISPVFGYFIGKFFETPAFKKMVDGLKDKVASMFGSIASGIANVFRGGVSKLKGLFGGKDLKKEFKIPSLQVGGIVKKGGIVNVHPAEVIMPIDKALSEINLKAQEQSTLVAKTIERGLLMQSINLQKMLTVEKEKSNIIFDFIRNFKNYNQNLLLEIKRSLAGPITIQNQIWMAWQKTLEQHPFFRYSLAFGGFLKGLIGLPITFGFGRRRMFSSELPKTSNIMVNQLQTLHLIYTGLMWQLEHIKVYLYNMYYPIRDLAIGLVGGKYRNTLPEKKLSASRITRFTEWIFERLDRKTNLTENVVGLLGAKLWKGASALFGVTYKVGFKKIKTTSQRLLTQANALHIAPILSVYFLENIANMLQYLGNETALISNITQENYHFQKRKNIWEFAKTIFFGIKDTIGSLVSTIGSFIGGAKDFLVSGVTAIVGSGAVKTLLSSIVGFLPMILSGLASVLIGGGIGGAIGTWINKTFINPIMDKKMKEVDRKGEVAKARAEITEKPIYEKARKGDELSLRYLDIKSRFGMDREALWKTYGRFVGPMAYTIMKAQEEIMAKNAEIYAQYGADQIQRLRHQFWNSSEFKSAKSKWPSAIFKPDEYGRAREETFLQYLQKYGIPIDLAMEGKNVIKDMTYDVKKTAQSAIDTAKEMVGLGQQKAQAKINELSAEGRRLVDEFSKKYGVTTAVALEYYNKYGPQVMQKYMEMQDRLKNVNVTEFLNANEAKLREMATSLGIKNVEDLKALLQSKLTEINPTEALSQKARELRQLSIEDALTAIQANPNVISAQEKFNTLLDDLRKEFEQHRGAVMANTTTVQNVVNNAINQGKEKATGWWDKVVETVSPYTQKIISGDLF
ncbi:MAG: hypothetical protein KatS3mg002_0261 [Candidatus Woesearchaeota archaeon]|nr:MAG: hypothetical protein KatS3mg002_0261 [Candidatus Woesearchaeota archaeon]